MNRALDFHRGQSLRIEMPELVINGEGDVNAANGMRSAASRAAPPPVGSATAASRVLRVFATDHLLVDPSGNIAEPLTLAGCCIPLCFADVKTSAQYA
jgi:hypothetical protein